MTLGIETLGIGELIVILLRKLRGRGVMVMSDNLLTEGWGPKEVSK